jgi:hypothetical protein
MSDEGECCGMRGLVWGRGRGDGCESVKRRYTNDSRRLGVK